MMTREQIERIAGKCGVEVSYTEPGKGGFTIDSEMKDSRILITKSFEGLVKAGPFIYIHLYEKRHVIEMQKRGTERRT